MNNQDYKNSALAALKGNWAPAVVCTIVFIAIAYVYVGLMVVPAYFTTNTNLLLILTAAAYVLAFFLYYPLTIGYMNSLKKLDVEGDNDLTRNMFKSGFKKYFRMVWGGLLFAIKVFLWSLLLIIPGIIKEFSYAMTPYILEDDPDLSVLQAIKKSKAMMKGHKFDLFYLWLSFIGWILLSVLTLGIGLIWLSPYIAAATAEFYQDVRSQYEASAVSE